MEKKKLYAVATSHLDTVWSWDLEESIRQYIKDTFIQNFHLFENYKSYKFSFEGSYRYELMEEYYPEYFKKMSEYIKEGRWNVTGSAFENGDVNVPSPEALFRNILVGNSYFHEKFGKMSCDIYLPDCFGFGYALPSVMKHANLKGFTTQKLTWGSAYGMPFNIGRWRGVDGNEVFAVVNPGSYSRPYEKIRGWDFIEKKLKENEKYGLNWDYTFHGVGDRGGATKEKSAVLLEKEVENNKNDNEFEVYPARADEIFYDLDALPEERKNALPVWDNELVMKNHAVGGYTSRVMSKRWNRHGEEMADLAERSSVIAEYLGTFNYNRDSLLKAWKHILMHHFHDDMPGTSCQRVYKRSWNDLFVAIESFKNELGASLGSTSVLLDTTFCKGTPVTVFNSIEAERISPVTVRLNNIKTPFVKVFDSEGNETPAQTNSLENGEKEVTFTAILKPLSIKAYDLRESQTPSEAKSSLKVSENSLENERYSVTLNENGDISSVYDKELQQELLKEPIVTALFNYDGSLEWPAWEMSYKDANKSYDRIPKLVSKEILENGNARVSVKVIQKDDRSTFTNIISLSNGSEFAEVKAEVEWQSLRTMAKNVFSVSVINDKATFDLGLGAIERGNMSDKLFEVPAQKWADITASDESYGVSVLSECKYGWDKFNINTLRLTAIHTPKKNYRIDSMQSMMDLGLNRYSYAIMGHKGKVGKSTQLNARIFTQPLVATVTDIHSGIYKSEYSFGEVSTNDIIIRAIKKAENSEEIVVRLNEGTKNEVKDFTLTLGNGIESAREIYASEEAKGEATVVDGKLVTSFKPYEIKSFALKLKDNENSSSPVKSTAVELDFNKSIITKQGETADFTYTLPYEILPESFTYSGIDYKINKDGKNALICNNQEISLPENTKQVSLLIASLKGDKNALFKTDEKEIKKFIPSMFERIARWDLYDFKETTKIKDVAVALEATHCHKNGEDEIAKIVYFFKVNIDTENASSLTLPADEDIVLLSLTALNGKIEELKTPVTDEVKERDFAFKMTLKEKCQYHYQRLKRNMGDKKFYERKNWGKDY